MTLPTKKQAEMKASEEEKEAAREAAHLEVLRKEEKRPAAETSPSFFHSQCLI